MALELVGGAALGAVFSDLYGIVKDVLRNGCMFKSRLEDLNSELNCWEPMVEQIIQLSNTVGHPREETAGLIQKMVEGKTLVQKCSSPSRSSGLNLWKTSKLEDELRRLQEDIRKFFQTHIPLYTARIGLENLAVSNVTKTEVNDMQIDIQALVDALQTAFGAQIGMRNRIINMETSVHALHQAQNLGVRNARLSCAVPLLPEFIIGLGKPLKELKRRLLSEKVSPLVLTGPRGCGKTTLAIKFGHDKEIKDVFKENIFFITVSRAPEVRSIAHDLFDHLGCSVPEFRSDEHAIHQVGLLFREIGGPILLIMDDVWPKSESLVREFEFSIPNYCILVTSSIVTGEDKSVCTLQPLDDEHALALLRHSAKLKEESHLIPEEYIEKILRDCEGYALALVEIGLSFRGKPPEAWQSWVMDRSAGHLVLDSCGELLKRSQEILRCLDDKAMECFLDLGLFPVGQRIPLVVLIEIWTVLYKLDRARGISILNQISSHNLAHIPRIDECYFGGDYSGYVVEQPNFLKELAIHQSNQGPIGQRKRLILPISENESLDSQSEKELLYIKAHSLSITIGEKFSSSEHIIQPTDVEVLVLNFQLREYELLEFVKKMEKLKVLIVTNYGFPCGVKQENWSTPVLKKIILENGSTSLVICCIGQASENCDIKISDALPNTVEIHMGSCCYLVELPVGAFGRAASNCSQVAGELVAARTVRLQESLALKESCRDYVIDLLSQAPKTLREFMPVTRMLQLRLQKSLALKESRRDYVTELLSHAPNSLRGFREFVPVQ